MLKNHYLIAFGLPLILFFCGALIKKLVRGTNVWEVDDWFLGIELVFASLSESLLNIIRLSNDISLELSSAIPKNSLIMSAALAVINLFGLLFVMAIHQTWKNEFNRPVARNIWLGLISNSVGIVLLAIYYLGVK